MAIETPIEVLELRPGGRLVTRVLRFEEGRALIHPRRAPQGVEVPVLRMHVPPEDKLTVPHWWDVTATTAQPTLRGILPRAVMERRFVAIQKHGEGPWARFTIDLLPRDYTGGAIADTVTPAGV